MQAPSQSVSANVVVDCTYGLSKQCMQAIRKNAAAALTNAYTAYITYYIRLGKHTTTTHSSVN